MTDILYTWDVFLFQLVNQRWTHPVLDDVFVWITLAHKRPEFLFGILPAIIVFWVYKDRQRALKVIFALAVTVGLVDNLSHRGIKPYFERPRPHHVTAETQADLKLDYSPSGWSFTSNHAANNFAGATLLTFCYPTLGPALFLYAFLVAYSRPYVGVHYPSDVAAGALLGLIVGLLLYRFLFARFLARPEDI